MEESRLEMAQRHVLEGRRIVERQRQLIARLREHRDTTDAERLLGNFERSLVAFEVDLEAVSRR